MFSRVCGGNASLQIARPAAGGSRRAPRLLESDDGPDEACYVTPTFLVRHARPDDVPSCTALALVAAPGSDASLWRASLLEDVESPDRLFVVAEYGTAVIGYGRVLQFVPEQDAPPGIAPRGYYLMGLVVHPDHRRTGVGAALTQARLDWISQRSDVAWYFANARNAPSIALHAQFGFEEVTRSFSYPRVDFEGGEGVLFRLRFPGLPAD
jgi:ribosomal protein S18 acetylase RimI-like enzyme